MLHDIDFDYLMLWGHSRLSIDLHQRLHGNLTDPWTTSFHLGNLGLCYAALGQIPTAIEHHQQALTIDRDIGNRRGEAADLGNLGNRYAALGQIPTAIEHHQQALTIDRDIGDRRGEAADLTNLGLCYATLGQIPTAIEHHQQAIEIADEIGYVQAQCEARIDLAQVHLRMSDFAASQAAAEGAAAYDYPPQRAQVHLMRGIAQLRQGAHLEAQRSFTTAIEHAEEQLRHTSENYYALDRKALALCGLMLVGEPDRTPEAIAAFRAARKITTAPGIVSETMRLLDAIAAGDDDARLLTAARVAAQGEPPSN